MLTELITNEVLSTMEPKVKKPNVPRAVFLDRKILLPLFTLAQLTITVPPTSVASPKSIGR